MTRYTNQQPGFYALWSREQLIGELCRMNGLLNEIEEITTQNEPVQPQGV